MIEYYTKYITWLVFLDDVQDLNGTTENYALNEDELAILQELIHDQRPYLFNKLDLTSSYSRGLRSSTRWGTLLELFLHKHPGYVFDVVDAEVLSELSPPETLLNEAWALENRRHVPPVLWVQEDAFIEFLPREGRTMAYLSTRANLKLPQAHETPEYRVFYQEMREGYFERREITKQLPDSLRIFALLGVQ